MSPKQEKLPPEPVPAFHFPYLYHRVLLQDRGIRLTWSSLLGYYCVSLFAVSQQQYFLISHFLSNGGVGGRRNLQPVGERGVSVLICINCQVRYCCRTERRTMYNDTLMPSMFFGLPRSWGGPGNSARTCNGLEGTLRGLAGGLLTTLRTAWGDIFLLHPDAKDFISEAGRVHRNSRERYIGSRGSGEAGHRVGTHARQEGWECPRWLGRLHPVNGNQGAYRATKRRATFVIETKNEPIEAK